VAGAAGRAVSDEVRHKNSHRLWDLYDLNNEVPEVKKPLHLSNHTDTIHAKFNAKTMDYDVTTN
jgi:hypothetical protein